MRLFCTAFTDAHNGSVATMQSVKRVVGVARKLFGTFPHSEQLAKEPVQLRCLVEGTSKEHMGILVCSCTLLAGVT